MLAIIVASFFITAPWTWKESKTSINFLDALYTTTSAISTTGLTIYDISEDMTWAGQFVIFLLIITGGFGFIFFKIKFFRMIRYLLIRPSSSFAEDSEQQFERGYFNPKVSKDMLIVGFWTLIVVYFLGAIILFLYFCFVPIKNLNYDKNIAEGFWVALFHSVSATNNAGFDIFQDGKYLNSLEVMNEHIFVQIVSIVQFLIGGFGFVFFLEIWRKIKDNSERQPQLNFARIIVISYIILMIISVVLVIMFEAINNQKNLIKDNNLMKIIFNTLSTRSAGFSTVNIKEYFSVPSKYLLSISMWIGCAPLSTGGGVKTTTFIIAIWSIFGQQDSQNNLKIFKKSVSANDINFIYRVCFFSIVIVTFSTMIVSLNLQESSKIGEDIFLNSLFYSTSALGNVGLNTFQIAKGGWIIPKIITISIMLIGQIGVAQTIQKKTDEIYSSNKPYLLSQKIPF